MMLLLFQLFSLKAEAFLRQQKHDDAEIVLLAAQKVEDALRRVTTLPADTTTLLVQAQIDMALGRYLIIDSHSWFYKNFQLWSINCKCESKVLVLI